MKRPPLDNSTIFFIILNFMILKHGENLREEHITYPAIIEEFGLEPLSYRDIAGLYQIHRLLHAVIMARMGDETAQAQTDELKKWIALQVFLRRGHPPRDVMILALKLSGQFDTEKDLMTFFNLTSKRLDQIMRKIGPYTRPGRKSTYTKEDWGFYSDIAEKREKQQNKSDENIDRGLQYDFETKEAEELRQLINALNNAEKRKLEKQINKSPLARAREIDPFITRRNK